MIDLTSSNQNLYLGEEVEDKDESLLELKSKNEQQSFRITNDEESSHLKQDTDPISKLIENQEESVGDSQYQDSPHGTFTDGTHWFLRLFFVHLIKMNIKLNAILKSFNHLTFRDIPNIDKEIKVEENSRVLTQTINQWCAHNQKPLPSSQFFKMIVQQYRNKFLNIYFYLLGDALTKVVSSIALQEVIKSIQISENVFQSAIVYIGLQIISIILAHRGGQNCQELSAQIRMCLISTLFKKINSLSCFSIKSANLSKCFNLISINLQQLEAKFPFYFLSLISPITLCVCAFILYQRHGYVGIITIILLICVIPIQNALSKKATSYLVKKTIHSDKRVNITNEILEGIKLIKMYAWERAFCKFVEVVRSDEMKEHIKFTTLNLISLTMTTCSALVGSFFVFSMSYYFSLESSKENNFDLSSSKMFSTISLLFYIRVEALLFLSFGFNLFHEQKVFAGRYLSIINIPNTDMKEISQTRSNFDNKKPVFTNFDNQMKLNNQFIKSILNRQSQIPQQNLKIKLKLKDFSVWWNNDTKSNPVISNLTIEFKQSSFNALIGRVGSGKTSLLYSLIRETPIYSGSIEIEGSIAFCGQEPCIIEGTVRENIIFGKPFLKQWYDQVIQDCQLLTDLSLLQNGDLTEIGEKGVNLSGGQKSRIALARAVYSNSDIYVLDDPLSAVDSKVARQLIEVVFKNTLKGKMIIMATHQMSFVYQFDNLIILEEGKILAQGNPAELSEHLKMFQTETYSLEAQTVKPNEEQNKTLEEIEEETIIQDDVNKDKGKVEGIETDQTEIQIQKRQRKIVQSQYEQISINIYKRYLQGVKKYKMVIIVTLYALGDVILTVFNRIVSYFDDITFDRNTLFLLLGFLNILRAQTLNH